jgi:ATP synthase protein I
LRPAGVLCLPLMADPDPPTETDRLSSLRRRLDAARGAPGASEQKDVSAGSLALRFGGEFGAAILVGALLGFGADYFLRSEPWGLTIGLVLGFVAGVANVVRLARAYSAAHPPDPNTRPRDDEDE